ncbi:MAG: hypothetical protein ACTSPY_03735 [Candidatus Helarchaeota archaeon]
MYEKKNSDPINYERNSDLKGRTFFNNTQNTELNNNLKDGQDDNLENNIVNILHKFMNEVYLLIKDQQNFLNNFSDKLDIIQFEFNELKMKYSNLEAENYNTINKLIDIENGIEFENGQSKKMLTNYNLINEKIIELRFEIELLYKRLSEIEREKKVFTNEYDRNEEYGKPINDEKNIVFIKASDLRKTPDYKNKLNIPEYSEQLNLKENINPKNNLEKDKFIKFLYFLERQYEIGNIDQQEYLSKKNKIEHFIKNV